MAEDVRNSGDRRGSGLGSGPRAEHAAPWPSPAIFAGADREALAAAPSEKTFYDALGVVVFLISCVSGCAAWLAASYAAQVSPRDIWWVAPGWAFFILCIERLILQLPSKSSGWLIVGLLPRVLLSLLVAVGMEPLILLFNKSEIDRYINGKVTHEYRAAQTAGKDYFSPKIEAAEEHLAEIRRTETKLETRVSHWRFLHKCEAEVATCSASHKLGLGPYWERDAREAQTAEADLQRVRPEDRRQIRQADEEVTSLREAQKRQEAKEHEAIAGSNGFSARFAALGALERKDPLIIAEVWFLRVLFVVVDLIPLTTKVWRMFAVKPAPYDEAYAAARRKDALDAKEKEAANDVRGARIDDEAAAEIDINRTKIHLDAERQMDDAYAAGGGPDAARPNADQDRPTISAWSLATFAENMTAHETQPVSVPSALRRGGFVGLAAFAGLAVAMQIWGAAFTGMSGLWLVLACLVAYAALATYTRGFSHAPAWALRPIFAGLLISFFLPVLILAVNV